MKLLFRSLVWGLGDQVGREVGREVVRAGLEALTEDSRRAAEKRARARARRAFVLGMALLSFVGLALTLGSFLGHIELAAAGLFLIGLVGALAALAAPHVEEWLARRRRDRAVERTLAAIERDCET